MAIAIMKVGKNVAMIIAACIFTNFVMHIGRLAMTNLQQHDQVSLHYDNKDKDDNSDVIAENTVSKQQSLSFFVQLTLKLKVLFANNKCNGLRLFRQS